MKSRRRPGEVRDAIQAFLTGKPEGSIREIQRAVEQRFGQVPASSVRSSLQLSDLFERVGRGRYRLAKR